MTLGRAHLLYDEDALIHCIRVGTTPRIRKIHAADHCIIPGFCEKLIDVYVERLEQGDDSRTIILLESSLDFIERYGLLMASSLNDLNSQVTHKVRLLNANQYDISINQDATLCMAENTNEIFSLIEAKSLGEEKSHPASPESQIRMRRINNSECRNISKIFINQQALGDEKQRKPELPRFC